MYMCIRARCMRQVAVHVARTCTPSSAWISMSLAHAYQVCVDSVPSEICLQLEIQEFQDFLISYKYAFILVDYMIAFRHTMDIALGGIIHVCSSW
jgi:hypothetical protein